MGEHFGATLARPLADAFLAQVEKEGISRSQLIRKIVEDYLTRQGEAKESPTNTMPKGEGGESMERVLEKRPISEIFPFRVRTETEWLEELRRPKTWRLWNAYLREAEAIRAYEEILRQGLIPGIFKVHNEAINYYVIYYPKTKRELITALEGSSAGDESMSNPIIAPPALKEAIANWMHRSYYDLSTIEGSIARAEKALEVKNFGEAYDAIISAKTVARGLAEVYPIFALILDDIKLGSSEREDSTKSSEEPQVAYSAPQIYLERR